MSVYLVTGGAGFIGSNIVERLLEAGEDVRVLDDFSTGRRENLMEFDDRIELIQGSVTDLDTCVAACKGAEYVLHQAALPSVQRSVADPLATHEADATGTLNLLNAARETGVRRLVYAGSSSAYGDTPELPKREDMLTNPRSPYAVAKLAGEHYCRAFTAVYGLETVVLRYFNVFGPRQDPTSQYSAVIPIFVRCALDDRSPTIDGDGEQTRDFTYVGNVVDANLRAARAGSEGVSGEVFNVGCGDRISVNRLWSVIRELVGTSADAVHGAPRPGDVRDSLASTVKIAERLGYEPGTSLEDGLERTLGWMRVALS